MSPFYVYCWLCPMIFPSNKSPLNPRNIHKLVEIIKSNEIINPVNGPGFFILSYYHSVLEIRHRPLRKRSWSTRNFLWHLMVWPLLRQWCGPVWCFCCCKHQEFLSKPLCSWGYNIMGIYWEYILGTSWESNGNNMGIYWEYIGNTCAIRFRCIKCGVNSGVNNGNI